MHAWQFMRMLALQERYGLANFVSMQNHYSLLYREEEREMLPLCRELGIAITPWSPLARGLLAGSRKAQTLRAATDKQSRQWYVHQAEDDAIISAVEKVAVEHGVAPAQVALAWVESKPGITCPIIGASKPSHLEDAIASLSVKLTPEQVARLEAAYRPREIAGHS